MPLHYSQEETEQHDGWSLFGYYLAPTNEFYRKILAPREFMEIVSPEEVRQEYAAILEKMLGQHR
ncbi:WYL domain-containing protein [Barnesiella intestinihominis]|uniref:WYL domain-containing protein n=1 Tax=Barnesiella intestinihominis TaxID=487174 RepID=UPI003AB824C7